MTTPPPAPASPLRAKGYMLLLALAVVIGSAVVAADALLAPPGTAASPGVEEVDAGDVRISYCPVVADEDETVSVIVAAVGDEPSEVSLERFLSSDGDAGGAGAATEPETLQPGERRVTELETPVPVEVTARGGQVVSAWRVSGQRSATGTCDVDPAPQLHVAGLDTGQGSTAWVHLFNPFSVDAVVRFTFGTDEGPADLVSTENIAVEAGQVTSVDLTELQPEQPELGLTVETLAGRVVAQGEVERLRVDADDEGPQGRALLPATSAPVAGAHFAHAADGNAWSSYLSVYNPNDREAAVRVRTTDLDPASSPEEISVRAGGVARVDLAGRSEDLTFAAVVESLNDLPLVVSRYEGNTGRPPGVAVPLGAGEAHTRWATAGTMGERDERLSVHNPGTDAVEVTVTAAGEPVEGWQQRSVEANERVWVPDAGGEIAWPAVLEATGPVAVEVVSAYTIPDEDAERESEEAGEAEEQPEPGDLGRVVGLMVPAQLPESTVEIPRVRTDRALRVRPVVPVDEEG